MADSQKVKRKRKDGDAEKTLRKRRTTIPNTIVPTAQMRTAGKIHRIFVRNFMCHDALEIILNPNVNFIIGENGSGKSALLVALTVGLGARAGITQRGNSVKDLIQTGKNSATIEVSLINEGSLSYKPEDYGNMITVVRNIGSSSNYKLKSAHGKVISTKREELDNIIHRMNIQVENPVSVMNQDVSREFLITADASQKYKLFIKATQMDIIGDNYKEAQLASEEARRRLEDAKRYLTDTAKEVEAIEKSLKMLESIESSREKLRLQQMELAWAHANVEEKKLQRAQKILEADKLALGDIERVEVIRESKEEELTASIEEHKNTISEIKAQSATSSRAYEDAKNRYMDEKSALSNKSSEWKSSQAAVKRTENDISMINQEMKKLESKRKEGVQARLKEQHSKLKQDLEEVEAMLRTKQTHQMHLQTDKQRLQQDEHAARDEVHDCETRIATSKQALRSLQQQSDISVTVFGAEVPRLLKRIEEEYRKGRFKEKPIGPLGVYIKVKDASWTPAVERYLGAGLLEAFAVDNTPDLRMLRVIMKEIYRDRRTPLILVSKFIPKVHDISRNRVYDENYMTLLDVMEISEPVVSNCLIDQKEPECIMLIPKSKEASEILSDRRRVPRNCKRGLTKQADEFFPVPNYRSYGGKVGRPRYLQVSTMEAIEAKKEVLAAATEELSEALKRQGVARDKLKRTLAELQELAQQMTKLRLIQTVTKEKIDALEEELADDEPDCASVFLMEKEVLGRKLVDQKEVEKRLRAEMEQKKIELGSFEEEVNRLREVQRSVDRKVNEIKHDIQTLEDQKERLKLNSQHGQRRLLSARQAVQKSTAEYDMQKRVTDKMVAVAEKQHPRIETVRSVAEIQRMSDQLQAKIAAVEQNVGSKEILESELAEKREKYADIKERVKSIGACNDRHLVRVQKRREIFREIKKKIAEKVQTAFASILRLRQYKGSIKISHLNKTLELDVSPQHLYITEPNDACMLSGGERSYSTVAFILALWECTSLPFYFLDEFDIFMDKVNRRVILDILLDHTRSHPQCQFGFLTPLDTSVVQLDDYLTVHQLAPPRPE